MPCPPPTQAVTIPYFLPSRFISFVNWIVNLHPVHPSGWPKAIAPPLTMRSVCLFRTLPNPGEPEWRGSSSTSYWCRSVSGCFSTAGGCMWCFLSWCYKPMVGSLTSTSNLPKSNGNIFGQELHHDTFVVSLSFASWPRMQCHASGGSAQSCLLTEGMIVGNLTFIGYKGEC